MNCWEGKIIRLRGIEPDDIDFFFDWNLETETQRNLDRIWFPTTRTGQIDWIRKESLHKGENDEYFFVIEDKAGKPVGSISSNSVNKTDGTFRYGIAIMESERNKGYAKEALRIFLNYYFNELRYNKVNASVYEFNESSKVLHEMMEFKKEGQLREVKFTNGKYWDIIIYGMTRTEFNKLIKNEKVLKG